MMRKFLEMVFGIKAHSPQRPMWVLLAGRKVGYSDYLLTVEHRDGKVQIYRTHPYPGVLYPQGTPIDPYDFEFRDWIDAQCIQYEWSTEHSKP